VRFASEKRWLLGLLALLVPLPLPFNGVVGWLSLTAYSLAIALFLVRVASATYQALQPWAMNLLGLLYLPILAVEMSTWWKGQQLMRSLTHLILFALVVKLFSLRRERDYWQALLAIFFLFLAAMGTSVHPSVVLYLLTFLFSSLLVLARFTGFEVLAEHGAQGPVRQVLPLRGFVVKAGLVVLLAAIPMFAILPRLKQPYLFGPGVGDGGGAAGGGFAAGLRLDTIGTVRTGRSVVLRFSADGPPLNVGQMRFRAASYDLFQDNTWRRGQRLTKPLERGPDGYFHLEEGQVGRWLDVWLSKGNGRDLILPEGTGAFDVRLSLVGVDDSGAVKLPIIPTATFDYKVGLLRDRGVPLVASTTGSAFDLDESSVTPRIQQLAAEVMGDGSTEAQAERLERYLMSEYSYTLELGAEEPDNPVENFLFDTREGHCEYFATSMVLLLRSQGVPARMVSGYLGAELNPLEGYYIVRQSNAHAWVEALIGGQWRAFDPTPASGRPQGGSGGLLQLLAQTYDYLLFRWDRYVLTYGFLDQADIFVRARNFLQAVKAWFGGEDDEGLEAPGEAPEGAPSVEPGGPMLEPSALWRWGAIAVIALLGVFWLWRARAPWNATVAYRSLRSSLPERASDWSAEALAPLEVERQVVAACPDAEEETRRIVRLYLEESFAARRLSDAELADLRGALGTVKKALREAA
jgi:transglutaminase-like putative cysteine protease